MPCREIDMTQDPRSGQFAYFSAMADPYASVTVTQDITRLIQATGGKDFFPTFLYLTVRAANRVPQLRRRLREGTVVEYDFCPPSYTAMKSDGVYVYCTPMEMRPYKDYIAYCRTCQQQVIQRGTLTEDGDPLGHLYVSCLPWLTYTSIKNPLTSPEESHPIINWGKYMCHADGQITLPVTLSVNHALADGIHIAQFFQNLEEEIAELCHQIENS